MGKELDPVNHNDIDKLVTYLGPVMEACRKRAGFTQAKLAELLNCTPSTISEFEKNQRTLKVNFLRDWAKVTNSNDVVVAFIYGEQAVRELIKKLKSEGFYKGEDLA
ncbi:helix-turn-helix domain-containing protein [uncultured Brevibacillus sp.]|uniref:helix-turn-helix domain-containing protein n=1 Tax=uncultured Brevibacillus sp. TaxID=169970 RepID=UPI0025936985|nr:helix-turn-helix transcriptional regulator [uncultured Brevibacillus sp.]